MKIRHLNTTLKRNNLRLSIIPKAHFYSPKVFPGIHKHSSPWILAKAVLSNTTLSINMWMFNHLILQKQPNQTIRETAKEQAAAFVNVQVTSGLYFLSNCEVQMCNPSVYLLSHSSKSLLPFCSSRTIFKLSTLTIWQLKISLSEIITQKE